MIETLLADAELRLRDRLDGLSDYRDAFAAIGADTPPEPRWNQDWFPRLDAAMAYEMVRRYRPRRIVEIGAGHSTRFLARAICDGGLDATILSVDPAPRASIDTLPCLRGLRCRLQDVAGEVAEAVRTADLLFVDSSHVMTPGSDVDIVLHALLPALPTGALAHFHDIFLPDGYPSHWTGRRYNEQAAVAALLLGGGWRVMFASSYALTRFGDAVAASAADALPIVDGALESSLWLEREG